MIPDKVTAFLIATALVLAMVALVLPSEGEAALDAGVTVPAATTQPASADVKPGVTAPAKKTPVKDSKVWLLFLAAGLALVWEHFVASTKWASNSTVQLVWNTGKAILEWLGKRGKP